MGKIEQDEILQLAEKNCYIIYDNEMVSSQTEISEQIVFDFAEWMVSGVSYVDDTERGRVYDYKHKVYTTKELFEEFLKTKQ